MTEKEIAISKNADHNEKTQAYLYHYCYHMGRIMRKRAFCICKNKGADQLCVGNLAADQGLCFRYIDSIIYLLPKAEISSLYPFSVVALPGLYQTWSETPQRPVYRLIWQ